MAVYHAIRRIGIPQSLADWVSVKCPIATSRIVLENSSATSILVRTEHNPDYVKRVPANAEYTIESSSLTWDIDAEVCEVQAPSADAVVVASFVR